MGAPETVADITDNNAGLFGDIFVSSDDCKALRAVGSLVRVDDFIIFSKAFCLILEYLPGLQGQM